MKVLRMALARMGCCTQLLYRITRASKNAVKSGLTSDRARNGHACIRYRLVVII